MKLTKPQATIAFLLSKGYELRRRFCETDMYWVYELFKGKVRMRKVSGIIVRSLILKGIIKDDLTLK